MIAVHWQRFEGAVILVIAIMLFWRTGAPIPWWGAVLLFLAPDVSFAGYLAGPRVGAACYNMVHVYAFGLASFGLGSWIGSPVLSALGALWLGHSGFDRMLGYGLKSADGFGFTHLGRIGKQAQGNRPLAAPADLG